MTTSVSSHPLSPSSPSSSSEFRFRALTEAEAETEADGDGADAKNAAAGAGDAGGKESPAANADKPAGKTKGKGKSKGDTKGPKADAADDKEKAPKKDKNQKKKDKADASPLQGARRYARYCVNELAPGALGLPPSYKEHDEFCVSFAKEHAEEAEKIWTAAKVIQPSLGESYHAERAGEDKHASEGGKDKADHKSAPKEKGKEDAEAKDKAEPQVKEAGSPRKTGKKETKAKAGGGKGKAGKFMMMMMMEKASRAVLSRAANRETRTAHSHSVMAAARSRSPADPSKKWPSSSVSYWLAAVSPVAEVRLNWAMNHLEQRTCIRFTPHDPAGSGSAPKPDHQLTVKESPAAEGWCYSPIGVQSSSPQPLFVGEKCSVGSLLHVLMHALGFDHTPTRLDRDDHLAVNQDKAPAHAKATLEKHSAPWADFGPYDFKSILHLSGSELSAPKDGAYGATDATTEGNRFLFDKHSDGAGKNQDKADKAQEGSGKPARNSPWDGRAQRITLSLGDAEAIQSLYCKDAKVPAPEVPERVLVRTDEAVRNPPKRGKNKGEDFWVEPVECFYQAGDHDLYVPAKGDCRKRSQVKQCSALADCQNNPDTCGCEPTEAGCDGQCFCQNTRHFDLCRCMKPFDPRKQLCLNPGKPTSLAPT